MSSAVRETEPKASPGPDIPDRPARILIVDDERHDRQLLEVMLASEGFALSTAASGEEALAMVAQQPFDLILLDLRMTGMDGCQVTARIKANPATRHIPVIMVTAVDDREARMLGLGAGAEDFLSKPVDRAELRVRVRNLLRLKAYGEAYDKYSQMLEGEVVSRTADLVERTTTLEALRRQYELVLDSIADGVYGIDLDGPDHDREPGRGADVRLGCPGDRRPPRPDVHHPRRRLPYPGRSVRFTTRCATARSGASRTRSSGGRTAAPFPSSTSPRPCATRADRRVVVTFRDITARREAERQRRESEEQYRLLFESNPHPMYVVDAEAWPSWP